MLSIARNACLDGVKKPLDQNLLKGVSRSFYLTLRLLPIQMRGAASLGYLLARTSDTLADTVAIPAETRMQCLENFDRALGSNHEIPRWSLAVLNAVGNSSERILLESVGELFEWLDDMKDDEADLVREVVKIIISGQRLDIERFDGATHEYPVALLNADALDDYTWRVAGCVGAFWTKLGYLTMGEKFSKAPMRKMFGMGVAYGKGLQLVNILRDLPVDLAIGRCYLPVSNPGDPHSVMAAHDQWLARASEWVGAGYSYSHNLQSRRLRTATVLPAMIAKETLARLHGISWEKLQVRVKIPRSRVYAALANALLGRYGR
ncbi:MAG: squalene/phytoene synthase family protein [Gloeobacteraceae cyanobacterium ES-bin-144]|nr:squalene/phytoene synthase family protein [Verrucomicrobiales bacterium]